MKIGDKILCTVCIVHQNEGKIGIIVSLSDTIDSYPYQIEFSDQPYPWWGDGYLATDLIKALV